MTPDYSNNAAEHARRSAVIAGGVNSNVRLAGMPVPLTFTRADGSRLWDVDGNEYVDYAGGMGPMLLGHNHPVVNGAVVRAVARGQLFAGQTTLEAEFGELLTTAIPWVDSIRVGLTGTEMDLLAVRIARATTGRSKVIRFVGHYHGWLDPLFVNPAAAVPAGGQPPLTPGQSVAAAADVIMCEWNDVAALDAALGGGDVACVLMEPIMCNTGLIAPADGYLQAARELCTRSGALLIIDEVITGFRFGLTGAQGTYGVHGDLTVYAKAIASGFPLAVLGASGDVLAAVGRGEVNHSGTYNAGVSSLAAGVATLRHLVDTNPYPDLERVSGLLADGINQVGQRRGVDLVADYVGGSMIQTRFGEPRPMRSRADFAANSDRDRLSRLVQLLQDRGVRPTSRGLWFVSTAHSDADVAETVGRLDEALGAL